MEPSKRHEMVMKNFGHGSQLACGLHELSALKLEDPGQQCDTQPAGHLYTRACGSFVCALMRHDEKGCLPCPDNILKMWQLAINLVATGQRSGRQRLPSD